ncbi:MAG TPA: DUF4240 domain-containing protein [Phycisphaerales bacterium]|nr:DUF4240 domain-containing protein [Phycisphaerales bacterium]
MTRDQFWSVIEAARRASGDDKPALLDALRDLLARRTPAEVRDFKRHLRDLLDEAYTWDLWGAAFLMNGGCSDDAFEYWRAWLIAQGCEVYQAALRDPETLARSRLWFGAPEEYELESLLYVADEVHEDLTGGGIDLPAAPGAETPRGRPWAEEDLAARFPALSEKFPY